MCAHNPIPLSGNAPYNQAGKMSQVTTSNQCSWYRKMWRISRITLHHLSTSFESVHQDIPLPDLSCSLLHDVCKSPEAIFTNCHQHAQELALFSTLDICKTSLTISSWWLHSPLPGGPTTCPKPLAETIETYEWQGRTKKRIFGADSRRSRSWMILDSVYA